MRCLLRRAPETPPRRAATPEGASGSISVCVVSVHSDG
jgi:hypothetical protein